MHRQPLLAPTALASALLFLLASACGKGDADAGKGDAKADTAPEADPAPRDPSTSLDKVTSTIDLSGPVPPEISMVFFTLDGALVPLGCYDKDKKKLRAGKECLPLAPKGAEVYLKAAHAAQVDAIGEPKNALCEVGEDKPTSLSAPSVDAGAAFDWATSPKSAAQKVLSVSPDTWSPSKIRFTDDERAAVQAAIEGFEGKVAGNKAEIHQAVGLDLDGDGKDERLFSAYVVNPRDTARYLFSGVLLARGADPSKLLLVEKTRTNSEVFKVRAAVDLDGDGRHELWINATFDEGGGDRMVQWKGDAFEPLGKWTCGM